MEFHKNPDFSADLNFIVNVISKNDFFYTSFKNRQNYSLITSALTPKQPIKIISTESVTSHILNLPLIRLAMACLLFIFEAIEPKNFTTDPLNCS